MKYQWLISVTVLLVFVFSVFLYFSQKNSPNKVPSTPLFSATSQMNSSCKTFTNLEEALRDSLIVCRLDLSSQGIKSLPSQIGSLPNLQELDLSNNQLKGLPAEVGHIQNLEILNLSNNKLTGLPYELGNLKKLKVLNLSGNNYSKQDLEIIKKGLPSNTQIIL